MDTVQEFSLQQWTVLCRNRENGAVCSNDWSRTEVRLISLDLHICLPYLDRMFLLGLVLLGPTQGGVVEHQGREDRSLANTFPFDGIDEELPERETREGFDNLVSGIPFSDVASSYAGGKRWALCFVSV